jgi:membrane protein implicated in regulation of membrane protease activity
MRISTGILFNMKINLRFIFNVLISLIDDIIIFTLIVWVMSLLGIKVYWWIIVILALILGTWGFIGYRTMVKNPALGFENMVGKTGLAIEPLKRKGTVRPGHEIWQATSLDDIEQGTEVIVVGQIGLKLTVAKKIS